MKFLVIVKATKDSEAGILPTDKEMADMMRFNEQLMKAGMILDAAGLHPTSKAKRIRFDNAARIVTDGPFAETKELVAGYWLLQAKSLDEVTEWMKRCPCPSPNGGGEIEIRPLYEMGDFPAASDEVLELNARLEKGIER